MDIKSEVQIKDEFLESSEDFQQEAQSFEQDLGLEEIQSEILCTNVDVKDELLDIEEERTKNDQLIEKIFVVDESQV
ncbi:hypothetical protein Avbf_17243 [Armadillidium vulgare]|nr:hypothetical protein Avbf_17243 [Armadillidium vulgare]